MSKPSKLTEPERESHREREHRLKATTTKKRTTNACVSVQRVPNVKKKQQNVDHRNIIDVTNTSNRSNELATEAYAQIHQPK